MAELQPSGAGHDESLRQLFLHWRREPKTGERRFLVPLAVIVVMMVIGLAVMLVAMWRYSF